MSGTTTPPPGRIPPDVGLAPPPSVSMPYWPNVEPPTEGEELARRREQGFQDVEADHYRSTDDLRRDAERTRERVNKDVLELRHRLGMDADAAHAHGPFAPVRRHPLTVAVATVSAATAAIVGMRLARGHRKSTKDAAARKAAMDAVQATKDRRKAAVKAAQRRRRAARKAARRGWAEAKGLFGSAASVVRKQRKKTARRLSHH